jgi:nucleoside-diphosphate-sugar epimerase
MEQFQNSVFVTGGTGLVGSHLLYKLVISGERPAVIYRSEAKKEFVKKVFGYYSEKPDELFNSLTWINAELDSIESLKPALRGAVMVYHCAAEVSFDPSDREKIIKNNIRLTENIVQACIELGVSKLCHVSSVAAIGSNKEGTPIREEQEWYDSVPHSAYAISKHLSEDIVWEGIKRGLNAVIINPSVIFGPGDWDHGSSEFFSRISKGMLFYTKGVTGYVDVRDVADSMVKLMNSPVSGRRFIISSENLSFYDIFSMIAESLGAGKPHIYIPRIILRPAMGIIKIISAFSGRKSAVTSENLSAAWSKQIYDNSRIIRETGISFIPVRKSIEDTCRIYLQVKSRNKRAIQ